MSDRDAFEKCTRPCMNRHPIFLSESPASSAATVTRFSPLDHHPRSLGALFSRHLCRARQAALEATAPSKTHGSRIFTLFLWRRLSVFDLAGGNIDNQI
jgi:hypothetical protein